MDKFKSVEEVYAVVFGVLARDEGKVVPTRFNKIITEFGLDKVKAKELQEVYDSVTEDPYLNNLVEKAIDGEVKLGDLQDVFGDTKFKDNEYDDIVSNNVVLKERRLSALREFNKASKQGAYLKMLMEDLKEDLKDSLKGDSLISNPGTIHTSRKELVICLSDIHVGAINTDYTNGGYNFEVLKERLSYFIDEAKEEIITNNIEDVTILFGGDLVEHVNMRSVNQAFDTEFTLSEQISKATRLLIDIIKEVRDFTGGRVRFGLVAGNHDRMQGNKNEKIYNDSVAYITLDTIIMLSDEGVISGVDIVDNRADLYNLPINIKGKKVLLNHGDNLKGNVNHIPKFIKDDVVDLLITGHVHHSKIKQEDYTRQHITVGSPMGYNNYSKELNLSKTSPSQTLLVIEEGSPNITIKPVFLD